MTLELGTTLRASLVSGARQRGLTFWFSSDMLSGEGLNGAGAEMVSFGELRPSVRQGILPKGAYTSIKPMRDSDLRLPGAPCCGPKGMGSA